MKIAQDNINDLFISLRRWCDKRPKPSDLHSFDDLALICLNIAGVLVADQRLGKMIGMPLSLITNTKKALGAEAELINSFRAVDRDLEANLRGFSGLLAWILEEEIIRRDPATILNKIPHVKQPVVDNFNHLSLSLEAYLDLDEVFLIQRPPVLAVLFLLGVKNIYDSLMNHPRTFGREIIDNWLKQRVKSQEISVLYNAFLDSRSLDWVLQGEQLISKDLLLLLLCYKVAKCEAITGDEAANLDQALTSIGMTGLKPLVDSGFLTLDRSPTSTEKSVKTHAKILRMR